MQFVPNESAQERGGSRSSAICQNRMNNRHFGVIDISDITNDIFSSLGSSLNENAFIFCPINM